MFSHIKKNKSSIREKWLVVCLICVMCLSACGTDKNLKAETRKIVKAVESKNVKEVEAIVLGTEDFVTDEELVGFFSDSESGSEGIIAKIIEQDSIKVKKITDKYIIYEIVTPELSNIFNDAMKEENLTAESFEDYIFNYIATTNKTKIQVNVSYTYEDGVFTADYSTKEFVNGLTGNLIVAYQELIQQMIHENGGDSVE